MTQWIMPPSGLIEPVPAPEIRCDRIGALQRLPNGEFRVHLVRDQLPLEDADAEPQGLVVGHIDFPALIIPDAIGLLARCLIGCGCLKPTVPPNLPANGGSFPRAVK
jgi:hypothetical protein